MKSTKLQATPQHELKPKLEWFGKILGCDIYIDLSKQRDPQGKRIAAEEILKSLTKQVDFWSSKR